MVTHFPDCIWPKRHGAHVGFWQRMDSFMALGAELTLVAPRAKHPGDWRWSDEAVAHVKSRGIRIEWVETGPRSIDFWVEAAWRMYSYKLKLSAWPWPNSPVFWRPTLYGRWRRVLAAGNFDLAFVNYAHWAELVRAAKARGIRRVLEMHDLLSKQYRVQTEALKGRAPSQASCERFLSIEVGNMADANLVLCVNKEEAAFVGGLTKVPVEYLPNGLPEPGPCDAPIPSDVLCVGSDNALNKPGLRAFLDGAWPAIRRRKPDARMIVCGSIGNALRGTEEGVTWVKFAPDLNPYYRGAKISVLTTIGGSGLKLKAVEAMSYAKCIVAHLNSVEAMPFESGRHGVAVTDLTAAGPLILELLDAPERRARLGEAALALYRVEYSFAGTANRLGELVAPLFKA